MAESPERNLDGVSPDATDEPVVATAADSRRGWYLIGGVAIGALGLFGWNQFQGYQVRRAEEAAA